MRWQWIRRGQDFPHLDYVSTDASGNASFVLNAGSVIPVGERITATAKDSGGNASEFSACRTVTAQPTISRSDETTTEGDSGTTNTVFTVSLSAASGQQIEVDARTLDGNAVSPADFSAVALHTLTFAPGQTSKTLTVPIQGDTLDEPTETLQRRALQPLQRSGRGRLRGWGRSPTTTQR